MEGSTFCSTCLMVGQKVVRPFFSSLCFRVAFFLVAAMPKGPAPDLPAISYGTTLAVDLAKVAVYCPATHGLGIPIHTVAERFS